MNSQTKVMKATSLIKTSIFMTLAAIALSASMTGNAEAGSRWIPGHFYYGEWIPGHCYVWHGHHSYKRHHHRMHCKCMGMK
jgi:hypothetical protein